MEIIKLSECGVARRKDASRIFVDGFYTWLKVFSKDKNKLILAMEHIFNSQLFYVSVINDEIAAIAACCDNSSQSVALDKSQFVKYLGSLRGSLAYKMLNREFIAKQCPFDVTDEMATIEFVATSQKYRGKGCATELIKFITDNQPYSAYALEVADTNTIALSLYEKLGFKEFMRVKEKHSKRAGLEHYIYMRFDKANNASI